MISVCIATYNGEEYIRKQLESILKQLSTDDEVIVSDDNSTDNTLNIISSLGDKRIKVLHHSGLSYKHTSLLKFRRVTDNFENALSEARGDIIFLSDQDDIWAADKVKKMSTELQQSDLVQCNCGTIDSNGNVITIKFRPHKPQKNSILYNLVKMPFLGCCMAFNRKVLNWALPFPEELIAHDFWIGVIGTKLGKSTYIDEPLHYYRQHSNNVSPGSGKSNNSLTTRITYRLELLKQIFCRIKQLKKTR